MASVNSGNQLAGSLEQKLQQGNTEKLPEGKAGSRTVDKKELAV